MANRVGGSPRPGGARLKSDRVGGYTGIKPGGMRALVKGTKPGG